MSNLIYGIFYADGYVDGGRDTMNLWAMWIKSKVLEFNFEATFLCHF